jgi:hypothetical protein
MLQHRTIMLLFNVVVTLKQVAMAELLRKFTFLESSKNPQKLVRGTQ